MSAAAGALKRLSAQTGSRLFHTTRSPFSAGYHDDYIHAPHMYDLMNVSFSSLLKGPLQLD
jgi:hypothetical protein